MSSNDRFADGRYADLIDWGSRLRRETPFLEKVLGLPPSGTVADLGSGSGEHARWLAARGWTAVGLDTSEAQIESARRYEGEFGPRGPRFLQEDILRLPEVVETPLNGAICLGNVLPYFDDDELAPRLRAIAASLAPGAPLLVQLLNYQRIRAQGLRTLGVNLRPDPQKEEGELVWLRLFTPRDERHLFFHPITLEFTPGTEEPVVMRSAREIVVRSWTWPELEDALMRAGFTGLEHYGNLQGAAFDPEASHDLVFVARRAR